MALRQLVRGADGRRLERRLRHNGQPAAAPRVEGVVDRTGRRFRTPRPGDEIDLCLSARLERELSPRTTAARVHELRQQGVDRLRVRVLKAPRMDVLAEHDAIKVMAPELAGETGDAAVYVHLDSLDLPAL